MAYANEEENSLQKSLVYFVSRRGDCNYWCTVINGMSKRFTNDEGTLSVQLTENWRYMLTCHMPFFDKCSPAMKRLVLIHEAAHVCLNHIPRLFKMMANCTDPWVRAAVKSVFNWAMDFAANDAIVRLEPKFKEVHRPKDASKDVGEWTFLLPEEFGLPVGKSMEEYVVLLLKDLPAFKKQVEQMMKDLAEKIANGEFEGEFEFGDSDGEGDDDKDGSGNGRPRRGRGLPSTVPGLPGDLIQHALNQPETFEMLQKAFDKMTGKAHKQWNEKAESMTPEEAISAGNKMKKHAQALARSANERVKRDRGFMSGNAQRIIDALLEPEQIPWDSFLRDIIQGAISARVQEEMGSPNLALINEDYMEPWPGQMLEFGFNITWMTDTSGSMGDDEYARACACINSLLAINKNVYVTYIECDAALQKEQKVDNVQPPDDVYLEELRTRRGYGGTVYAPFFRRVAGADEPGDWVAGAPRLEDKHPHPDLMVICTDGGVSLMGDCFPTFQPNCPIVWLLMPGCHPCEGMDNVAPNRLIEMFKMREED